MSTDKKPQAGAEDVYRHDDPAVDEALEWLVRIKGSAPSASERSAFEAWLRKSPDHRLAWESVAGTWSSPEVILASAPLRDGAGYRGARSTYPTRRRFTIGARVGAGLLMGAALFAVFGPDIYRSVYVNWKADYRTVAGQVQEITLPDGSKMILNTQSSVALDFEGTRRHVELLEGEAWFDVVHDSSRPFHVTAHFSDVEVKGTAFAVEAEQGADAVLLQRGSVQLRHNTADIAPIILSPGEMARASRDGLSQVVQFDPEEDLGWKDGRVVLTDKPLNEALEKLSTYYQGRVLLLNTSIANVPVSGNFRVDNAKAAIDSIVLAAGGRATHLMGGLIIIR